VEEQTDNLVLSAHASSMHDMAIAQACNMRGAHHGLHDELPGEQRAVAGVQLAHQPRVRGRDQVHVPHLLASQLGPQTPRQPPRHLRGFCSDGHASAQVRRQTYRCL